MALALGCTTALASPSIQQRSDVAVGPIYAYGTNITGLEVFVADSVAYVGNISLSTASSASHITFYLDATSLVATPSNSSLGNETLAIDTTSGAFKEVIFNASSTDTGYVSTGFHMYGTMIAWANSEGILASNWYAEETEYAGLWTLKWNTDNLVVDAGKQLVLKNLGPITL
ncbi:hypothetical protein LTR08_003746 [Meristemomyces frigidus]|nr:hypothetical protein LTR08_003746 [Meristemomyces frigidus]